MFSIVPYRYNRPARRDTEVRDPFNAFADSFFRSFWGDESASTFKVDVEDKGDHYCLEAERPYHVRTGRQRLQRWFCHPVAAG